MTDTMPVPPSFWPQIHHQLRRISTEHPDTFDAVRAILMDPVYDEVAREIGLNGVRDFGPDSAFFAGSGGDDSLHHALSRSGWHVRVYRATYHYVLVNERTGEALTYTEGDVERGGLIADDDRG